ncbi:MAG: hypothetical protein CM1200mP26_15130 [Acidimicrobiales bacterium]|nr:MAG: hypothetical protein CM1200mP26_15130 [Acidimicrobiales bacterium]
MDRYGQIRPTGDHDAVKSTIDTGLRPVRCTTVVDPGYVLCYQDWPSAYDSVHLEAKGALRPSFKLAHSVHVHGSFESSTVRVGGDRINLRSRPSASTRIIGAQTVISPYSLNMGVG